MTGWNERVVAALEATLAKLVAGIGVTGVVFDKDIDIGDIHLLNIAEAKVNPATEDKQDDIVTALGTPAQAGEVATAIPDPATATLQGTGNTALGLIQTAVQALAPVGLTIKRAAISAAAQGDNQLVALVADKKIRVLGVFLVAKEAVDVTFYTGAQATGTPLSGTISLTDYEGFVLPPPTTPAMHWMETAAGELLNLYLSAAKQVSGCLLYYEEA